MTLRPPYYSDPLVSLYQGDVLDVLRELPDAAAQTCVTSPPYYALRDYGVPGQIGLEPTPEEYVAKMVCVFREVRRVLRDDGTLWLNIGDSYAGSGKGQNGDGQHGTNERYKQATNHGSLTGGLPTGTYDGLKSKDLIGIPWMLAFALRADGWYLRSDIIWHKPNPMPESVTDRPTKAHEYLFLLTKSQRYYYDAEAVREEATGERWGAQTVMKGYRGIKPVDMDSLEDRREQGRNRRTVWTIATQSFSGAMLLADYVGEDGRPYKVSQDCPVHGDRGYRAVLQTAGYGEQQDQVPLNTGDSDGRLVQGQRGEGDAMPSKPNGMTASARSAAHIHESTDDYKTPDQLMLHEHDQHGGGAFLSRTSGIQVSSMQIPDTSDLQGQEDAVIAIGHSTETHRMGHDPETSPAYSVSGQTTDRIDDRSTSHDLVDSAVHKNGNNTVAGFAGDGWGTDPSGQTTNRTARRSKKVSASQPPQCNCTIISQDHFATFPEKLVEPCILAGTSERGACPACGAPWRRVVEREPGYSKEGPKTVAAHHARGGIGIPVGTVGKSGSGRVDGTVTTLGWQQSCACPAAEPVPCTVLEPFAGSGTTAMVARQLVRKCVAVDLNPAYLELAVKRVRSVEPGFQMDMMAHAL